jgi:hypothetical protein
MIRLKSRKQRYLFIGVVAACIGLATVIVIYLLTRPRVVAKPVLTSITVTVTHPDGKPLANTALSITNFGYAWNGMTDKDGNAVVPPQAIAAPIHICALNTPRTTKATCDLTASIDNAGKALDPANSLLVSLHDNMK